MTIGHNLEEFYGKPVRDFDTETGIESPATVCYRIRLTYDVWDEGTQLVDLLESFAEDEAASGVTELVIGVWDFESGDSVDVRDKLVEIAPRLPKLEALHFGDITYEESEISWIEQSDLGPVVRAFPRLKVFVARGGNGLLLSDLSHPTLEKLVLETGGMSARTINDVMKADLPALRHLELWLGTDDYGFDAGVHTIRPLLTGSVFPRLEYLGLRDSSIADEIAIALKTAQTADLSEVEIPGKTFVLTGSLVNMTRSEAKKALEAAGGSVSSSVSKTTDYLVAGEKAGSKMEKAKDLGVPVLSEADLIALLGTEGANDVSAATQTILDRIHTLDLSMGTLSDTGAQALLDNPKIAQLEKLDIHWHYVSDGLVAKLKSLGIEVDASDQQEDSDDWRYVAVAE